MKNYFPVNLWQFLLKEKIVIFCPIRKPVNPRFSVTYETPIKFFFIFCVTFLNFCNYIYNKGNFAKSDRAVALCL